MTQLSSSSPLRRQHLADQVLEYLREQIANGVFPVGSKLPPEPELMTRLGVGRSSLREAMRVLEHMGLVEVRPGDGTYVRMPTPESEPLGQRLRRAKIFEVYEVRRTLELECMRLAALRRDEQEVAQMRQALRDREAAMIAGQQKAFIEADLTFHMTIAQATKNSVLADLYRAFVTVHGDAWMKASEVPGLVESTGQRLHEQMADAIEQQDPERAQRLIEHMLAASVDRFQEIVHDDGESVTQDR
ncbi:MAG TPA: FadR/GntR family transcriptional regulator [Ktedonobacteraceae bacterium]|nr:FadR/GntR family transcriptional regulator [Ktedonobacteraceae bacterium]